MVKKLPLSDFIAGFDKDTSKQFSSIKNKSYAPLKEFSSGITLKELFDIITNHNGSFLIDSTEYTNLLESSTNLYFYNNATNGEDSNEVMILFDPIIDIKYKNGLYEIYSYPNNITTILLRDFNGQKVTPTES